MNQNHIINQIEKMKFVELEILLVYYNRRIYLFPRSDIAKFSSSKHDLQKPALFEFRINIIIPPYMQKTSTDYTTHVLSYYTVLITLPNLAWRKGFTKQEVDHTICWIYLGITCKMSICLWYQTKKRAK